MRVADLRYSVRSLARSSALTIALWVTIALGIGSNASLYGFIRGLNTPATPPPTDRLVSLFARDADDAFRPLSYNEYRWLTERRGTFDALGAARESEARLEVDDTASIASTAAITPELARLLGLPVTDGAIISRRLRDTVFARKDPIAGQRARIDGIEAHVHAVAPHGRDGVYRGGDIDIWTLWDEEAADIADSDRPMFWVIGRLRAGTSAEDAAVALNATTGGVWVIDVLPYTGMTPDVSSGMLRIDMVLRAAAGLVFLVACANVAAFLLARGGARSHELSVRVALGARRAQIGAHIAADSLVIAVAGGALALALALWTMQIMPALFFDLDAEQLVFAPNLHDVLATVAACVAIVTVCGAVPLLEVGHDDPAAVLRRESAGPSRSMRRVRAGLVVVQLMCCCILMTAAGLLLSEFRTALRTPAAETLGQPILATLEARLGFDRSDLGSKYFHEAERVARSVAGVTGVAWTARIPGGRPAWQSVRIERPRSPRRDVVIDVAAFSQRSLDLIRLPPVAGRMFGGRDTPQACTVAIVNQEAADELFGGDAVGTTLDDPAGQRVEIVGVVAMKTTPTITRHSPMIYYYADQTRTPLDRSGPATFSAPLLARTSSALLDVHVISPSFLNAMGMTPGHGRGFAEGPDPHGCRIAVVNREAADGYFGGDAVGGAVIDGSGRRTEIVGVVRRADLGTLQRREAPAIYLPMWQDFVPRMTMIIGTPQSTGALVAEMRTRLGALPGGKSPPNVTTLDAHLGRTALAPQRIAATLVAAAAALALVLSALGVYATMAESTRHRRREIALRIALGANGWRVVGDVIRDGVRLAVAGAATGLIASAIVVTWLRHSLASAGAVPMWIWIDAPVLLFALVSAAAVVPTRRALSVDPLTLLRDGPVAH